MAGIYLHIPFCRKICGYCDFFKNASLQQKEPLLQAMHTEIAMRKDYLNEPVQTIYFGGGTPSVLSHQEIADLFAQIHSNFEVEKGAEITFEANPDDLNLDYLQGLKDLGVNRLSVGIQSFDDEVLQFMNRRHTGQEAINSIEMARQVGFENMSLDIIYGIPKTDVAYLEKNVKKLCALQPTHISAYHLTIEQGTPFAHLKNKGKLTEIADENSEKQYVFLVNFLAKKGYEQYEISNFCKNGNISRHNTNYWLQTPYLGIGASAHSYNGISRHWNISNLKQYCKQVEQGTFPCEAETLTTKDKYNDYIIVRLRTKWGIDLKEIEQQFGIDYLQNTMKIIAKHSNNFIISTNKIKLKPSAFLRSDYLITQFFII